MGLRELGMKNSAYCLFVYVSNFRCSDPSDRILVIPLFRIVLASQKGEDEAWRFTLHLSTQLLFWGFNCSYLSYFPWSLMSLLRLATPLWRKIRELPTTPDLSTLSILITLCLVQQWYLTTVAPIAVDEILTLFEDSYSSLGSNLLLTSPCAYPR